MESTLYVKEYEQMVPTRTLLILERDALQRVCEVYGPLPCDYRTRTGGDVADFYMLAHERLSIIDKLLAA